MNYSQLDDLTSSIVSLINNNEKKFLVSISYSYIDSTNLDTLIEIADPYKIFNEDDYTIIMLYKNDFPNKTTFIDVIEELTGTSLDEYKD